MKAKTDWKTAPISCTCEVLLSCETLTMCDKPTTAAYPAMSGGWMALCEKHAQQHLETGGAVPTEELIKKGETWI